MKARIRKTEEEQMKAEELMIGDWVYGIDRAGGKHPSVISAIEIYPTNKTPRIVTIGGYGYQQEHLEPIPLTEKILEYNFATEPQISWCVGWNRKDDIHIEIKREDINAAFYGVIAYVHQLQHALAICGINKEIIIKEDRTL